MLKSAGEILREAVEALRVGKGGEAMRLMLSLQGDVAKHPTARLVRGLAEMAQDEWTAAQATFVAACAEYPDNGQFFFNLALTEERLGQNENALRDYQQAAALGASVIEAFGNISNLHRIANRFDAAENAARKALLLLADVKPENAEALAVQKQIEAGLLNNLALALAKQQRFQEADEALTLAGSLVPDYPETWGNLANLRVDLLRFDEAWDLFAKARALDDRAVFRRDEGMARILAGDYEKGWELYEARLELRGAFAPPLGVPYFEQVGSGWNLRGRRILLQFEQGLGDTLQFCRFGRFLTDRGAEIFWRVQKPLISLLRDCLPGHVLAADEALPPVDSVLPLMSLPRACGAYAPCGGVPYLRVEGKPLVDFPEKALGKKIIGLVWAGSPTHPRDAERSIPLARFARLWAERTDCAFVAPFQGPSTTHDIVATMAPVRDLSAHLGDFAETGRVLQALDLLITVDTSVAHLAGALGVRAVLLIPFCPDWRWGCRGENTAWYNSVTVLRQEKPGDWDGVLAQLLARWAEFLG